MNKRNIGMFILLCVLFQTTYAQSNLLNARSPSDIGKKTAAQKAVDDDRPLEYGYVDDRDILWSKMVWEFIDLNERINLPLYYPVDTTNVASDRRSLFDTLLRGIRTGEITEVYDDSYFTAKLTKAEIDAKLFRVDTTDAGFDELNAGAINIDEYVDKINLTSQDIEGWLVMNDDKITVALDITITTELHHEGIARELINRIQNIRKDNGFEVTDKINISILKQDLLKSSVDANLNYICSETLTNRLTFTDTLSNESAVAIELEEGLTTQIAVSKI